MEIRCWRCQRKLAEVTGAGPVYITLVCTRCSAKNAMEWVVNTAGMTFAVLDKAFSVLR